jgi:hypothetical protein
MQDSDRRQIDWTNNTCSDFGLSSVYSSGWNTIITVPQISLSMHMRMHVSMLDSLTEIAEKQQGYM